MLIKIFPILLCFTIFYIECAFGFQGRAKWHTKLFQHSRKTEKPEIDPLVIETTSGKVQGIESISRSGKPYLQFLGIPFGKADRFESPQPADNWKDTFNASQYGPLCAQFNFLSKQISGQEDCLTINVLTPKEKDLGKKLPVFAYIHGGGFFIGASSESKGDYFMDHDVIFVNFNYRLGALGFLNTNDGVVRGNMGLKDQRLALEWIQNNIAKFGGDPEDVLIGGPSAGSICVNHHILSSKSKGLFSKALLLAGTAISPWGLMSHPERNAQRFMARVNCSLVGNTSSESAVSCLKNLNVKDLLQGHDDVTFPAPINIEAYFLPSVEAINDNDAFLTEHPDDILRSGNFNKVPLMGGVAKEEMLMTTAALSGQEKEIAEAKDDFNSWAPRLLHYEKNDEISEKIKQFYYKGDTSAITTGASAQQTSDLFSDRIFNYGLYKLAKYYSPHVPVFLYYHAWLPDRSLANFFSTTNQTWVGTSHGDDAALITATLYVPPITKGNPLYNLSIDVVDLFVQYLNEEWMSFRSVPWWQNNPKGTSQKFLKIDEVPDIVDSPYEERAKFWESLEGQIKNTN